MKNVALVGLGPHAKRIYLHYFKKHNVNLALVIDLNSKKDEIKEYLNKNGFEKTKIYTIADDKKDNNSLSNDDIEKLLEIFNILKISHLVISTEPKAHFMYLKFALQNDINVLTDKPITVTKDMTSLASIEKVRKQYYEILSLAKTSNATCKVMCQRQYHRGYEVIKKILEETVDEYKIPITNIDIFHSDGAWEFPHDLNKENHPYKYGYGKLFHSGYHFIDLLSDFIKINDSLGYSKKIEKANVFSKIFTPNDEMNILTIDDYKRLFSNQNIPEYYFQNDNPTFDKYGEKDFHGLLTFKNKNGNTITTANLNLLHNGVSRRSWIETRDFYKNNGRIRHERINIEIAHLLNIQVHSYQSKEIKDRTFDEEKVGGLEHFDIYIFRNPLIKGKTFEEIHLGDLYSNDEKKDILGYNELSRETFLNNFFNDEKNCKGDIKDQALAIEILYSCAKGIHNCYSKKSKEENITIRNKYTYRFLAKRLKNYSYSNNMYLEKDDIKLDIYYKDIYSIYNFIKYIPDKNVYEVYISLSDSRNIAPTLLYKSFKNKYMAFIYYSYLGYIIKSKDIHYIEHKIETSV